MDVNWWYAGYSLIVSGKLPFADSAVSGILQSSFLEALVMPPSALLKNSLYETCILIILIIIQINYTAQEIMFFLNITMMKYSAFLKVILLVWALGEQEMEFPMQFSPAQNE